MKINSVMSGISLDGQWDFAYTDVVDNQDIPTLPSEKLFDSLMPIPGCWDANIDNLRSASFWPSICFNPGYKKIEFPMSNDQTPDASLPFIQGVGWYRKRVFVPQEWQSQSVTLCLGPVRLEAWIWINENLIGYHLGHSTPFEITLDKSLLFGNKNELIIAVANTRSNRSGCDIRGYKGLSGGIRNSATLRITGKSRIDKLYVRPLKGEEKLHWSVELQGQITNQDIYLDWSIANSDAAEQLASGTIAVNETTTVWTTDTFGISPWSEQSPNLYRINIKLKNGNVLLDEHKQDFGMRLLECDGTKLRLNGNPVMLRGVTEHCYFPQTCTPPDDIETYKSNIRKIKDIGFNWIRFHTWVPTEEYMQAADELGMMIQVEPSVGFGRKEWIDMLLACRNHPSVVIYCCGNEELLDEEKIAELRDMSELCREYAPDALFNPQEALRGVEYHWTESDMGSDVTLQPFPHNAGRLELLKEFSDVFGQYNTSFLSYISLEADWKELNRHMVIYERPCLSHEIGIHGTYLDLTLEQRYHGTRIGTDLYSSIRQYLEKEGVLEKAELYYSNSCAWARSLRKHTIEMARKCKYIAGYDFLGPIDQHWHRTGYTCGIMNEFYELKAGDSVAEILKYNSEDVLLLDHTNYRNLATDDTYEAEILASLYGPKPLKQGTVQWQLTDHTGKILLKENISVDKVQNGNTKEIGAVSFTVPQLAKPAKVRLCTSLKNIEHEIVNDWDFWVFPKIRNYDLHACVDTEIIAKYGNRYPHFTPMPGKISNDFIIVDKLNADSLQLLKKGGRVVLLGSKPFPSLSTTFQILVAGRTNGNLATVVADHPALGQFPHDGYCDWQFYSMLEGGSAVVFNSLDIPFDPIIEVVSSFKLVHKQASLFELKVGNGRLLVCSLNLNNEDIAAVYMLDTLLNYARSDEFCPVTAITIEQLEQVIKTKYDSCETLSTDMAFDNNAQLR